MAATAEVFRHAAARALAVAADRAAAVSVAVVDRTVVAAADGNRIVSF
jgi:hypothetical protein